MGKIKSFGKSLRLTGVAIALFAGGLLAAQLAPTPVGAACDPLPSDKGQLEETVTVEADGVYTLWLRMQGGTGSNNVAVQVGSDCPVVAGDGAAYSTFTWVDYQAGDTQRTMTFNLTAGQHKIVVAGREAGAGLDKVILAADPHCIPTGNGDNCLHAAPAEEAPAPTPPTPAGSTLNMWVVAGCAAAILAAFAFLLYRYLSFAKHMAVRAQSHDGHVVVGGGLSHAHGMRERLIYFVKHHRIVVFVCLIIIVTAAVVGIVAAGVKGRVFEAEAAKLSGGAKVVDNESASGRKYVVFNANPASIPQPAAKAPSGGSSGGSSGGGSNNNGGSSGGGSNPGGDGGGGGDTWACALPKYPTPDCTGVPAGVSLATHNGSFTASTPNQVVDAKHITGDLYVRANGVVIKNSRINGRVDNGDPRYSFTIQDSTVQPNSGCSTWRDGAVGLSNYTAKRVEVVNYPDGFRVAGGNVLIEDSYVKLCASSPGDHSDGIQVFDASGGNNIVLKHNAIDQTAVGDEATAPIFAPNDHAGQGNQNITISVIDNVLGGGGYSLRIFGSLPFSAPTVTGNKIVNGTWDFGPVDVNCGSIGTWSGNATVNYNWSTGVISNQVSALNNC